MKEIEEMIQEDIKKEIEKYNEVKKEYFRLDKLICDAWNSHRMEEHKELKMKEEEFKATDDNMYYIRMYRKYYGDTEKHLEKDVRKHYEMLQKKVENKIGKILKIEYLGGYNYNFEGENGTCAVEVIIAGGYNIQRKHTRWIVKNLD